MKLIVMLVSLWLTASFWAANGAAPGEAPQLPITGARIVNVATEAQSVHLRDHAVATLSGNLADAVPGMFADPAAADLHLLPSAARAIGKASAPGVVTNDFDGELRPLGAGSGIGADEFKPKTPR